jgi:hypothetical protein
VVEWAQLRLISAGLQLSVSGGKKPMKSASSCLIASALFLCASSPAEAVFFENTTGLPSPGTTVTFDASGLADGTVVTNQFAGVTFSPGVYKRPYNDIFPAIAPGFGDDYMSNYFHGGGTGYVEVITVQFSSVVSEAAIALAGEPYAIEARLGDTLVDSGSLIYPSPSPGKYGFLGFTGIRFDRLILRPAGVDAFGVLSIDTVQFTAVPEPAAFTLMIYGLLGLVRMGRRWRHAD